MKKSAFSLLELSVSLVVVSLLMAMVSQGIKMVASSRLTTARSLTSKSPVPTIPGLIAWYETTSVDSLKAGEAVDGKQISTWYDISPDSIPARKNTLTRTASVAVIYKSDGINKIPSVYFNGSGRIALTDFHQGYTSQNTVFFVARAHNFTGESGYVIDSGHTDVDGSQVCVIALIPTGIYMYLGRIGGHAAATNCCRVNADYIVAAYLNGSLSKSYVNTASTMTGNTTVNPGTIPLKGITVGADRNNAFNLTGLVSEVIVYNRILQLQERKDVMGYLSKKYGIVVTGL